ncbi:uncharacterized protein TNCV_1481731 [Trichonephila clavipes]|nr:uncharacterized protein TNCV_1481731 [Trichonephila clavipes]
MNGSRTGHREGNMKTAMYTGFPGGSSLQQGSRVVQVSDRTCLVTSSSPVPLKTRRVGQRCTLNLSRAETSSRWCGSWERGCQLRCRPRPLTMAQNYVVRRQKPSYS